MSSSGMSDSDSAFKEAKGESFAQGNFSATLLPPIVDIEPPPPKVNEEVVMYSKEIQTSAWVPEVDSEEETEEQVKKRIEEEVRREMERLKIEEDRAKQEQVELDVVKDVPGIISWYGSNSSDFRGRTAENTS